MQGSSPQIQKPSESDYSLSLEKLLLDPKKSSSEWQVAAARLTAIAHSKTLSADTDDFEYLRSLALCRWAQTAGVIEAKKKNIQAIRFRSMAPPQLEILDKPALVNAALDLMVSIRGDWCKDYIAAHLLSARLDKKGLSGLLKWAEKTSQSAVELLEIVLLYVKSSSVDEKKALMLIKFLESNLDFAKNTSAESASINFLEAVRFINPLLAAPQQKKVVSALTSLLKIAVHKVRIAHPAVVVLGPFALAIRSILDQLNATGHKKIAQEIELQLIGPTLSLMADLCSAGGQDGTSYVKTLLPVFKSAYRNFDKFLDESSRTNVSLLQLKASGPNHLNLEDTAISIYARLLPSWHDFYTSQEDSSKLSLLNSSLIEAAKLNSIEFLGTLGEVLPFDPVSHRLQNEDTTSITNVRILKPAVIFKRENSTYRIVLPAIVSPV